MLLTPYDELALQELKNWQEKMLKSPSLLNRLSKKMQEKVNSYIPEKIHQAITGAIKQMIRVVLQGAKITTAKPVSHANLEQKEAAVRDRINFYKTAAAAEGGITGAGGILLGLADFPLFLSLKLKMLFDIAALYGYDVNDYKERVYLLYILQLAFSSHQHRKNVYLQIVDWETQKQNLPEDIHQFDWRSLQQEYRDYLDLAKMAQLIPVIGAPVGIVANYQLTEKLGIIPIFTYAHIFKPSNSQIFKCAKRSARFIFRIHI